MASIHAELRKKTNFSHIERLHNMLYAYGATLIEIVRRKEFGASNNSNILLESLQMPSFSTFFLSTSTNYSRGHGKGLVLRA